MNRAVHLGLVFAAVALASGLDSVKQEPNLDKRCKLALEYANEAVDTARQAYTSGDSRHSLEALNEIRESVDVCLDALNATGKEARKNPKLFKRSEMQIRELLRRLKSLESDFAVDDRAEVTRTEQHLHEVHDELITRIMSKHK